MLNLENWKLWSNNWFIFTVSVCFRFKNKFPRRKIIKTEFLTILKCKEMNPFKWMTSVLSRSWSFHESGYFIVDQFVLARGWLRYFLNYWFLVLTSYHYWANFAYELLNEFPYSISIALCLGSEFCFDVTIASCIASIFLKSGSFDKMCTLSL